MEKELDRQLMEELLLEGLNSEDVGVKQVILERLLQEMMSPMECQYLYDVYQWKDAA